MAIELDGLEFEIEASSEKASKNIDALAESLKKLKLATGAIRGLSSTSTQLAKLGKALDGFSNRNAKALTKIAFALDALGRVGKVQISSSIGKRITDIAAASKDIKDDDLDRLDRLADVLEKLGKVGDVKIPKMKIPQEQGVKESKQEDIENSTKAIRLRETSLAVNELQQSLVPLTQIMQTGASVWEGFEQVINATGEGISNVVGYLNEGIIEGTFRKIESVSGFLGDGISRAIVPAEQFSNALAVGEQRGITLKNTIEGTWKAIEQGSPEIQDINSGLSESVNISNILNSLIHKLAQAFEEVKATVSGIIASISEILVVIELVVKAIRAIIGLIGRIIGLIRSAIGFANKLLTPFKQIGSYVGKQLISPFEKAKNSIKSLTRGVSDLFNSFKRIALYRLVRTLIATLTRGLSEGIHNLYQYSRIMNTEFHKSLDKIATASLYVKNSLAAMVSPVINAIAPAIDFLADKMVDLLNKVNMFVSTLLGKSTYTAARKLQDTFEKIKSAVIGIDELNIIGDDEVKDYANMFEELPIEDSEIGKFAERLKEAFEEGDWESLGRLVGEKFNEVIDSFDWTGIGEKIGYYLDGAIKTAYYLLDEIDFGNFGEKIADLVNSTIEQVDWEYLGKLLVKKITSIWDFAIGFLKELDWGEIARDVVDFLKGAIEEISNWIDKQDWAELGKQLLEKITDFMENFDFEGLVRNFSTLLGKAIRAMKDLLTPLWDAFKDWWNEHIKGEDFVETLKNLIDYLLDFVDKNILTPFMKAFMGDDAMNGKTGLQKLKEVGENIIKGIISGAESYIKNRLKKWIADSFFGKWWDCVCLIFGIHSPATTMIPIGEHIMEGILEGMVNIMKSLSGWLNRYIVTPFVNLLGALFSGGLTSIPISIGGWIKDRLSQTSDNTEKDFEKVRFEGISENLKNIGSEVMGAFHEGFVEIFKIIIADLDALCKQIINIVSNLVETVRNLVDSCRPKIVIGLQDKVTEALNVILQTLENLAGKVYTVVISLVDQVSDAIAAPLHALENFAGKVYMATLSVIDMVTSVIGFITSNLEVFDNKVYTATLNAIDNASFVVDRAIASLENFAGKAYIATLGVIDVATSIVNNAIQNLKDFAGKTYQAVITASNSVDSAVSSAKSALETVVSKTYQAVITAKNSVENGVNSAKSALQSLVNKTYQALITAKDNVEGAVSSAKTKLEGVVNKVYQAVISAKDSVGTAVDSAMNSLQNVSKYDPQAIITAKDEATPTINLVDSLLGDLGKGDVVTTIGAEDQASGVIGAVQSALDSLPSSIVIPVTVAVTGLGALAGINIGAFATGGIVPHAKGSIINKPTLTNYKGQTHLFGEAGREAILPLDSYTGWMDTIADKVEERVKANDNSTSTDFERALNSFYQTCFEPVMSQISEDTRRQADKPNVTTVQIGQKTVKDAVVSQGRADGFSFVR